MDCGIGRSAKRTNRQVGLANHGHVPRAQIAGVSGNWRVTRQFLGIEQLVEGHSQRGQYAVEAGEREPTLAVHEIGDVRLRKTRAPGELTAGEFAKVDSPPNFLPQPVL